MREELILWMLGACLLALLLTVGAEALLVPYLTRRRARQPILEIGPAWHLSKSGTPTLGGLGFIAAILLAEIPFLFATDVKTRGKLLLLLGFALACGGVGLLDDLSKLKRKQNKGLSAWQKYLLLLVICAIFLLLAVRLLGLSYAIYVPFLGRSVSLGVWYVPLALLYLTGMINALNLTDGVDGLLGSCCAVFALFLITVGLLATEALASLTGALLLGGMLGFLCFNAHPARIFMGDTGSLFLGAMVAGYGLFDASPLSCLLASLVFVAEAASVILQVLYFKCTKGKRIFLMTPIHHHFEKKGWSEWRVVITFSLVGLALSVLALFWR